VPIERISRALGVTPEGRRTEQSLLKDEKVWNALEGGSYEQG
jgi:hypothetical protein